MTAECSREMPVPSDSPDSVSDSDTPEWDHETNGTAAEDWGGTGGRLRMGCGEDGVLSGEACGAGRHPRRRLPQTLELLQQPASCRVAVSLKTVARAEVAGKQAAVPETWPWPGMRPDSRPTPAATFAAVGHAAAWRPFRREP